MEFGQKKDGEKKKHETPCSPRERAENGGMAYMLDICFRSEGSFVLVSPCWMSLGF